MSDIIESDFRGLDKLNRALQNVPYAKIGILGAKNPRKSGGETNSSIGYQHEFGIGHPRRSFLRVPLIDNLKAYVEKSSAFDKDVLANILKEGTLRPWVEILATIGEKIVSDAFDSGGFGKWPAWKQPGYQNNTGQILVDTQQLRNSISSEVVG